MITTIKNNERVFMVTTSVANHYFCNIKDLPNVIKSNDLRAGYYKIFHFWNNKQTRLTKKLLKDMLNAHSIPFDFNY